MLSRLVLAVLCAAVAFGSADAGDDSIPRLRKDLEYLTSEECEGRGVQTKGLMKASEYIAAEFGRIGLKPAGTQGYFQPFPQWTGLAFEKPGNALVLQGADGRKLELNYNQDFRAIGLSAVGEASAPLVFVGYGITHEDKNGVKYNDYKNLDVAGKIVVVLRKTPPKGKDGKAFFGGGQVANQLGSLTNKLQTAAGAKAAGVLFVNDLESAAKSDDLMAFDYTSRQAPPVGIPCAHITRAQLDMMLKSTSGKDLKAVEESINATVDPMSCALSGWTAKLTVAIDRPDNHVRNIIGIREGKGPLAKEYIVIGAHYDHLGRGESGSTERDAKKAKEIHRGADDNGSGTVSILELARRFAADATYEGRTIVFMTFAGEEQGLLGSKYFCKNPTIPLEKVSAMLNLDMVGRLRPDKESKKEKLEIGGIGSAKEFAPLIEDLNKKFDFQIAKTISAFGPSDHTSFAEKNVPVFFLFTGLHQEYHKPSDVLATINFNGMAKIVEFSSQLASRLATMEKPAYVMTPRGSPGGRVNVPRISFTPGNYDESTEKGVLIGGVAPGGPADKAGLREGDFIVEIAGKPIRNMSGYMTVMSLQNKDKPIEFVIDRGGKKVKVMVKAE